MNDAREFQDPVSVSGEILSIHFTVSTVDRDLNTELWEFVSGRQDELETEVRRTVEAALDSSIQVWDIDYRVGSLEIVVILDSLVKTRFEEVPAI